MTNRDKFAKRSTPAAKTANPDPFGTMPAPDEQQGQPAATVPNVATVDEGTEGTEGTEATEQAPGEVIAGAEPPKADAVEVADGAEGAEGAVPPEGAEDPAVVLEREKQQRREALAQIAAEYEPLIETVRERKRAAKAREELIEAKQRAETEYARQFVELDDVVQAASRVEGSTWDARAALLKEHRQLADELRAMGETVDDLEQ